MKHEVKTSALTPSNFRIILIVLISLIALLHIAAIILGYNFLKGTSGEVTKAVNKSEKLSKEISQLQLAESILKKKQDTINLSKKLTSEIKEYAYQKQIIYDTIAYASRVGVGVKGFTFIGEGSAPGSSASKNPKGKVIGSVTTHPVTVSLGEQLNYVSFLRFLKYLEGNLTQTHAQEITFSISNKNPNAIEVQSINLEVYTRK